MYAIIKTGGKQYKVAEGSEIIVEKLDVEEGSAVTFEEVLAIGEGAEIKFGRPLIEGTNYRRRQGHRQPFTKVKIEKIEG